MANDDQKYKKPYLMKICCPAHGHWPKTDINIFKKTKKKKW